MSNPAIDRSVLVAQTRLIPDPGSLLDYAPAQDLISWIHSGEGMIAWGTVAEFEFSGSDSFQQAEEWWSLITKGAVVRDEVNVPGSGLIAFGSFAFDPTRNTSLLRVPKLVLGKRGKTAWVTTIGSDAVSSNPELVRTENPEKPKNVTFQSGGLSDFDWTGSVEEAVTKIQAGELEKVVLARDLVARLDEPIDVRWPLRKLANEYPNCWTFKVGNFFGATPEILVRRERGLVASRILAGTIRRTGNDQQDLALAASLARSSKDREEHDYAVQSVAEALEPHCASMNVPDTPFVLHLPNVMHLATDVTGVANDSATALSLAASLHPSAAVGGTPRDAALDLIAQSEGMNRGRYAGPVGWIDAAGDGEWAIGLRSATIEDGGMTVRLYAGCGIVADSHPADELAESNAKLIPVRDSLT